MRFPGFIGPSYTLNSKNVDNQRCINLYPVINEMGSGKEGEVASLVATPGYKHKLTLGNEPIRAIHEARSGRCFVVSGDTLFELLPDFTAVERGKLNTLAGPVSMDDSALYLVLVDGKDGFALELDTNDFVEIENENFYPADQVAYQDGYFIFNKKGTGQFFHTELNSLDFDALDIAEAEGSPDRIVGFISDHRELWFFGTDSTEVFFNSGDADNTFQRIPGAYIERGCIAPFSIAKIANSVYWLGRDRNGQGGVYRAQGYQPQKISTNAIDIEFQKYGDLTDARAWTYQEGGHEFYVLNFTNADTTWVYDATTNLWHERAYNDNGVLRRHRANCHAMCFGKHIIGDYKNGNIYELSPKHYTDDGVEIIKRRRAPHLSQGLKRIRHKRFQLDLEPGVGSDGLGQGTNPQAMLRWSNDGGHTWSDEQWRSIGKIGEKGRRVLWSRLGQARDRVYEVSISDPNKTVLIGAELDLEMMGN